MHEVSNIVHVEGDFCKVSFPKASSLWHRCAFPVQEMSQLTTESINRVKLLRFPNCSIRLSTHEIKKSDSLCFCVIQWLSYLLSTPRSVRTMAYQTPPPPSQELLAKSVTPVTINSQSPPSVLSASPDLSPISMLKSLCTGEGSVSGNDDAALKANNSNAIGLELNSASSNTRGANLKVVKKTAKKGKEKDKQTYLGGDSFQNKGATASKKVGTTKRPRQKASKIEDRSVCKLAGHVTKAGTRHRVDQKSTTGKDDIWEIKSSPEREGLGLEVATARKKDWTPIKDQPSTIINLADSDGSPAGNNHGSTPQALSFLSAYNYQASTENTGSRHTGAPKMNPTTKHQIEVRCVLPFEHSRFSLCWLVLKLD